MNAESLGECMSIKSNQSNRLSRRDFIKFSSVGALGYALASDPVMANAIHTDSVGLETGKLTIRNGTTALPVYVAKPQSKSNLPTIIVVSEIFGVHEYIADVARRFAKLGYLAIAPEFFYRVGDPKAIPFEQVMGTIISKTPDAQVLKDIQTTIDWAKNNGADPERIGINGFCWGGRITWLACEKLSSIKTGVAWYGRLTGEVSTNFPEHPLDLISQLKAPVLGLYGAQDTSIPVELVEKTQALLQKDTSNLAAQNSQIEIYLEAGHAFHADYRASYVKSAAEDGWAKTTNWFKEKLV